MPEVKICPKCGSRYQGDGECFLCAKPKKCMIETLDLIRAFSYMETIRKGSRKRLGEALTCDSSNGSYTHFPFSEIGDDDLWDFDKETKDDIRLLQKEFDLTDETMLLVSW
jgi:hypothetical protein